MRRSIHDSLRHLLATLAFLVSAHSTTAKVQSGKSVLVANAPPSPVRYKILQSDI